VRGTAREEHAQRGFCMFESAEDDIGRQQYAGSVQAISPETRATSDISKADLSG